jgi:hypothetical protein
MALSAAIEQVLSTSVDDLVLEQIETTENTGQMTSMMEQITNMLANLVTPASLSNDEDEELFATLRRAIGDQTSLTVDSIDRVEEAVLGLHGTLVGIDREDRRRQKSEDMDALEARREKKMQPDWLPFQGTPKAKAEKKEEKGLLETMLGGLKSILLGSAGGVAAMGVVGAFKGVLKMGQKFVGIMKKAFLPLTVVVGLWEGVTGFIDGFNENADDSGVQRVGRGIIQGLTDVVDTLVMKTLDLFKDIISWAAGKLGFEEFSSMLDSFSFSDIYRDIMQSVEDLYVGLWGWIEGLVGNVKNLVNKAAIYMGMDPIFDTDVAEQDMVVPTADNNTKTQVIMSTAGEKLQLTESQYTAAVSSGLVDESNPMNRNARNIYENARVSAAQDNIDSIREAVEREQISPAEGQAKIDDIKSVYGDDVRTGPSMFEIIKDKTVGFIDRREDLVPPAGKSVAASEKLIAESSEIKDMSSMGGTAVVNTNVDGRVFNTSSNASITNESMIPSRDDTDRLWVQ